MKKIAVLLFLIPGITGFAQQKLSLTDAINTALQNSYDIQLAKNSVEISNINNHIGVAGGLPVVSATGNDNEQVTSINQKFADAARDTKRNNVSSNNLTVGLTGSFLLFNGYRVVSTKKRLEELQQQNQQLLSVQIQNTIAAVTTKYFDVVRQQSYLKTIAQSIEVSKKRLEILQVRKEVGMSNNADIFQAQLDLNALVQSQQAQELVIDQAKTDLLNLIFLKPDTRILINDTIVVDRKVNIDSVRSNLAKNPLLAAADRQIRINELLEKETAALRYPTIRANAGYNLTSSKSAAGFSLLNQSYGPFIGINVAIPIYNGSISKRQQKVAAINTRNATIQRDNILLDNETGMIRTYQAYTNSLTQLETALKNYALSTQLLDLILQKFQLGQATIIDVKQAQQSFENEGYRLVNLNYAAKVAEIELKRLASQLALP
ncbi:MAG: TolC family protein [Chitinophagaceae bacterium]|nr:TolC family protein [Chitinophagaceae bacterium]MCA6452142.1 TolC family protein [Chitinophagaceae bacterium]MCA6455541.1 TolC family protein [Chitinophagaceae bacterium]MCA6459165.1 TolC family protein [Chitinophagaceae bacterium]MCA6465695.1 TolC family protein [Chitinophagaceae bacterium]